MGFEVGDLVTHRASGQRGIVLLEDDAAPDAARCGRVWVSWGFGQGGTVACAALECFDDNPPAEEGETEAPGGGDESGERWERSLQLIAEQLERWARESLAGGWSTHQVGPQRSLALAISAAVTLGRPDRIVLALSKARVLDARYVAQKRGEEEP